jgi:transposase InsO family protein
MSYTIHPQARTTPLVRKEIQASNQSQNKLAKTYGVSKPTIAKWQSRDSVEDKSHCPHTLHTTLTPEQEGVVIELRATFLLPLDDLLAITKEFINDKASRSGLGRCLARHGVPSLRALQAEQRRQERQGRPVKTFKAYPPGFVHIDVKYLPQMADDTKRRYLFVAIDRATRWVYLEIRSDKRAKTASRFLQNAIAKAPFEIKTLLTDNGKEFTDRFVANGEREPTGEHLFDQTCKQHDIEHRLIKPRHPQTNGMVERFNGRISEILGTYHFDSRRSLEESLQHYMKVYNHHIPQKALGHKTPVQALKEWKAKSPDLFKKRVYDQAGLDTPLSASRPIFALKAGV